VAKSISVTPFRFGRSAFSKRRTNLLSAEFGREFSTEIANTGAINEKLNSQIIDNLVITFLLDLPRLSICVAYA
jgi:hypothetical protein